MSNSNDDCKVPPEGWVCIRESGHDGPCAAVAADSKWIADDINSDDKKFAEKLENLIKTYAVNPRSIHADRIMKIILNQIYKHSKFSTENLTNLIVKLGEMGIEIYHGSTESEVVVKLPASMQGAELINSENVVAFIRKQSDELESLKQEVKRLSSK